RRPGRDWPHPRGERARRPGRSAAGQRAAGGEPGLVPLEARGAAAAAGAGGRPGMIRLLELADPAQRAQARGLRAAAAPPPEVASAVSRIVDDVRARGEAAVRELTRRFDGADLADPFLPASEW